MRLVVDTNIVFAGLLRDGTTRGLLVDPPIDLIAPEAALAEIRRNAEAIVSRSSLSTDGVELMLALLTEGIDVLPRDSFADRVPEARERIGERDPGDVPFLAVALSHPCEGVWTHNLRHFQDAGVEVWTTGQVLEKVEKL